MMEMCVSSGCRFFNEKGTFWSSIATTNISSFIFDPHFDANDANVLVFPVRQLCMSADRITAATGDVEAFTVLIDELLNSGKCLIKHFTLYTVDGEEAVVFGGHF